MTPVESERVDARPQGPDGLSASTNPRILLLILFAALAGLEPIMIVVRRDNITPPLDIVVLQSVISICAAAGVVWSACGGTLRPMAFFFWLFSYLWFGIAPTAQLVTPGSALAGVGTIDNVRTVCLLTFTAIGAFAVGYQWKSRHAPIERDRSTGLTWRRLYALTVASSVLVAYVLARLGGLTTQFTSRETFAEAASALRPPSDGLALQAVLFALLSIPPIVALLLWILLFKRARHSNQRIPLAAKALFPYLLALNAVANSPFTHPRSWIAVCAIGTVLALGILTRGNAAAIGACAFILGFVVVFPAASIFRYDDRSTRPEEGLLVERFAYSGDYDAFRQAVVGASFVSTYGHDFGRQLTGPLGFWVPRSVWQDKPGDTGVLLARYQRDAYTNLSAPLMTELYIALGYPAVLAGFVVMGRIWRKLDNAYCAAHLDPSPIHLVTPLLAVYQMAVLRGSLLTVTGFMVLIVLVPYLTAWSRRD